MISPTRLEHALERYRSLHALIQTPAFRDSEPGGEGELPR